MSTNLQKTKQIRILTKIHLQLKIYAAKHETSITLLISQICDEFLNKQNDVDREGN